MLFADGNTISFSSRVLPVFLVHGKIYLMASVNSVTQAEGLIFFSVQKEAKAVSFDSYPIHSRIRYIPVKKIVLAEQLHSHSLGSSFSPGIPEIPLAPFNPVAPRSPIIV